MSSIRYRSPLGKLWINCLLLIHAQVDWLLVVCFYYFRLPFYRIDWALKKRYFWRTPHMISEQYLQEQGLGESFIYGATPLTSLAMIAKVCGMQPNNTVFDLGCGPGRSTFFLHALVGTRTIGIDIIPAFIDTATTVSKELQLSEIFFVQGDFRSINYNDADFIYIYGTTFGVPLMRDLMFKFRNELSPGARIITISKPLSTYEKSSDFAIVKTFSVRFPLGFCTVFLHEFRGETQSE